MKVRITDWQAIGLVISTIMPTAILTVPRAVVPYSLQSSWVSITIAMLLALVVARMACSVCERYPEMSIFQITEHLLGAWFSLAVGLFLSFYYFSVSFYVLTQFTDFMVATVMPETPSLAFSIFMMAVVVYALSLGIEVIARANSMILTMTFITLCFSMLLVLRDAKFEYLLSPVEIPISNLVMGAYAPLGWLSEVTVIWLLAPSLFKVNKARKIAYLGVIVSGLTLMGVLLESLLVYKPHYLQTLSYPTFSVFRELGIGAVFERLDPFFIAVWVGSVTMKLTIFVFGAVYCLCSVLKISSKGPVLIPIALLAVIYASVSWENSTQLNAYSAYTFPVFVYLFNIILPSVLLLAAAVRRRRFGAGRKV